MWQIQWMIGLIPAWFLIKLYVIIMTVGAILYFGSKLCSHWPFRLIPFLGQYPLLSEIGGVALISAGLFCYGGYTTELKWQEKVKQAEAKVVAAEAQSKEANVVIKTKIVKQKQIVHDTQVVIQQEIKEVEKRVDAECKLDPVVPKILNKAAKNPLTLEGDK